MKINRTFIELLLVIAAALALWVRRTKEGREAPLARVPPMKRTLTKALVIATGAAALAFTTSAEGGAPFSCDATFEASARSGTLDPELKTWIVDTARRFYQDRSRDFSAKMRDACTELSCVSGEDIVTKVAKQCARAPTQTLELAVQGSLREIIVPAMGCDARCAMRLGTQ
jgi:hypothetical protein